MSTSKIDLELQKKIRKLQEGYQSRLSFTREDLITHKGFPKNDVAVEKTELAIRILNGIVWDLEELLKLRLQ